MSNSPHGVLYLFYKYTILLTWRLFYNRLVRPIFEIKDSPHSIALGLAVGLWISLTPTVGIQMTICLIVCTLIRANVLIAVAMCWISNPVTFIPMYYGYYRLGLVIMQDKPISMEEFREIVRNDDAIVSYEGDKNRRKYASFDKIFDEAEKTTIFYTSDESVLNLKNLINKKGLNLEKCEYKKVTSGAKDLFKAIQDNDGLVLTDWLHYNRFRKKEPYKSIQNFEKNAGFWETCVTIFKIAFMDVGIPMWVGSLIIATVLSIPAYPLTYKAIIKFRNRREKHGEGEKEDHGKTMDDPKSENTADPALVKEDKEETKKKRRRSVKGKKNKKSRKR